MPRKKQPPASAPTFDFPPELLENLLPGPMEAAGVEAVFQRLKKAVIERALNAEWGCTWPIRRVDEATTATGGAARLC